MRILNSKRIFFSIFTSEIKSLIIRVLRLREREQLSFQLICFFLVFVEECLCFVLVVFAAHLLILLFFVQHSLYSPFQLFAFVLEWCALLLDVLNFYLHFSFALFRLERLPHTVSNWALVQSLVSLYSHLDFVTYPDKKESSLGAINRNLPDYLIEWLRVQFLTNWANTRFPGLPLL